MITKISVSKNNDINIISKKHLKIFQTLSLIVVYQIELYQIVSEKNKIISKLCILIMIKVMPLPQCLMGTEMLSRGQCLNSSLPCQQTRYQMQSTTLHQQLLSDIQCQGSLRFHNLTFLIFLLKDQNGFHEFYLTIKIQ